MEIVNVCNHSGRKVCFSQCVVIDIDDVGRKKTEPEVRWTT